MEKKYIDSHLHLDQIFHQHDKNVSSLVDAECLPVSWSFSSSDVESANDIRNYLNSHQEIIHYLSSHYLQCYYLAGVHPRNIGRDLRPEDIWDLVLPYLDDPLCLGVGEIGLEKAGNREVEVLLAHLEMASEVLDRGKVFGIHTPRNDKQEVTGRILDLLGSFNELKPSIVVDHCTQQTIGSVLKHGFWAGITLSPVKSGMQDVEEIVREHFEDMHRIMLNTDSINEVYQDLIRFAEKSRLEDKGGILRDNPAVFFGLAG